MFSEALRRGDEKILDKKTWKFYAYFS